MQFKPTLSNPFDTLAHVLKKHIGPGPYPTPPGIKAPQPAPRGKAAAAAASTMSMHSFLKPSSSSSAAAAEAPAAAAEAAAARGGGKGAVRGSAIIYCWKRADCEAVATELTNRGALKGTSTPLLPS